MTLSRLVAVVLLSGATAVQARVDLRAEVGVEGRWFFHEPVDDRQLEGGDASIRFQPEFYAQWNNRDTAVTITPFGRLDSADEERSHWDIREAFLRHRFGDFEARVGVRRVFWGATESVHLVDIINQTDLVENPDGEDKLGQPMANLAWTRSGHTVDLFALPYFRERTFPGVEGRLRFPLAVSSERAEYESDDEEKHLDWAARYAYSGEFDLGLSHFSGTARNPRIFAGPGGIDPFPPTPDSKFIAFYELIERSGLDLTAVAGGWLLKLEAIHQRSDIEKYSAAATGFEYTIGSVFGTAADLGLIAEYLWDERGDESPQPFQNDIFVGARWALNDDASTEVLAGAIVDADTQGTFGSIEASRRIGAGFRLALEARLFIAAQEADPNNPDDPLYFFREDDYLGLELTWFY